MKTLHRRCAGLDVHSDSVVACARLTMRTKATHEVRRFSTTTRDLLELADWLAAQGITHIAMEATGVYWKPIWHILEGRFELVLANAAHIRNVPGRKSDVNDAVWISDLLAHGLIRASFVPPTQIQEMRDLTRTRTQLGREDAQHIQRIQKTLENANIKLTSAISNIIGTSGRRILKAMIRGKTNPAKLAELGSTRSKMRPSRFDRRPRWARDSASSVSDRPSSQADRRTGATHRSLRCSDRRTVGAAPQCRRTTHYDPRCKPGFGASYFSRARRRYDTVSDSRASVVVGGPRAQARRERGQAAINARSKGSALVEACVSPMCLGCSTE